MSDNSDLDVSLFRGLVREALEPLDYLGRKQPMTTLKAAVLACAYRIAADEAGFDDAMAVELIKKIRFDEVRG